MTQRASAYENALRLFDNATEYLDLNPGIVKILRQPKREVAVHFPVIMDDGSLTMFTGFRVQHSTHLEPAREAFATTPT